MSIPLKLKFPTGLKLNLVPATSKPIRNEYKHTSIILYALANKDENGEWKATVNIKGLNELKEEMHIEPEIDIVVLPFTEKSFELKGRSIIFRVKKDETGHWVRVHRTYDEANFFPGNREDFCTLCENCVFSGHIVKYGGKYMFNMSVFQGTKKQCENLLTKVNEHKKKHEVEEENEEELCSYQD